ncbi:MAG: hypothetical protein A2W91_00835 [Bacteroidetes bacterium GWF2_38_335]|nr:MAG: hypothetical protein A2W91_00835 [Bacteroidetes bacterium GWF2_38_335]OFY80301.1 MAG: hypothetical protein A2281_17345 [Bacteroidetes bacterium RIFOXYA12_FULL_38_20]HBS88900.1 hypothetical protein [Bacteroidales bacterium]
MKKTGIILITILLLLSAENARSQSHIRTFFDAGSNNVSDGLFLKSTVAGQYQYRRIFIFAASRFNLVSKTESAFSGAELHVSKKFPTRYCNYNIDGFLFHNKHIKKMFENKAGLLAGIDLVHWTINFGISKGVSGFTQKAADEYGITSGRTMTEKLNFIYQFKYKVFKNEEKLTISLTNRDVFLVEKEPNPLISVGGYYKLTEYIKCTGELFYKTNGTLNLAANYFGFYFRAGVKWELK